MLARLRTSLIPRSRLFCAATIVGIVGLLSLHASARESVGTLVYSGDSYRYKADSGVPQASSAAANETREAFAATLLRLESSFVVNFATLECGVAACMESAAFEGFFAQPRSVVAVYRPGDVNSGNDRKLSASTGPTAPVEGLFLTLRADRLALIRALAQAYPTSATPGPAKRAACADTDDRCVIEAILEDHSLYRIRQLQLPDAVAAPRSTDGTPALTTASNQTPSQIAAPSAVDRSSKAAEANAAKAFQKAKERAAAIARRRADAIVRAAKAEASSGAKHLADVTANLPASRRLAYASLLRCESTSDTKACFTAGMTANANATADTSRDDLSALCEDRYVDISSQVALAATGKVPFSKSHATFVEGQLQRMATLCPSESAWAFRMRRIVSTMFDR